MSESVKVIYCVGMGDSDICVGTTLYYMLQKSLGLGDSDTITTCYSWVSE